MAVTYNSRTDLSLGQLPNIETFEDVYTELLDIHNAMEILLNSSDLYVLKVRSTATVTGDFQVDISNGTILVDATSGDVEITLPLIADGIGYHYRVKRIDNSAFTVTVVGDAGEVIDDDVAGVELDYLEAIHVQNDGSKWWMVD